MYAIHTEVCVCILYFWTTKSDFEKFDSIKADFQASHEAPRSSSQLAASDAWELSSNHNAKQFILIRCKFQFHVYARNCSCLQAILTILPSFSPLTRWCRFIHICLFKQLENQNSKLQNIYWVHVKRRPKI
jgi:hypothetical protein